MTEFNLISTQTINTIRSSSFVYKEQLSSPQNSLKKIVFSWRETGQGPNLITDQLGNLTCWRFWQLGIYMHHLKSYQLVSFQNRSLFLMIINTTLCCWQKLSSQSFGQNTQWLLKLKLARLKPVALTVDSILLAEIIWKKVASIFPCCIEKFGVGGRGNMARHTRVIPKPISKAENGQQAKTTWRSPPRPLSQYSCYLEGFCACLHCSSDRVTVTPIKTIQSWKPDGFMWSNNIIYCLNKVIVFNFQNFLCWKCLQTVTPSPVQVKNKMPFSNRDGVGSNINNSQLRILHWSA